MAKYKRKSATAKKTKKSAKRLSKAMEYVNSLLKLHSLQGVLLNRLSKEV